jgi:hypothetical protein
LGLLVIPPGAPNRCSDQCDVALILQGAWIYYENNKGTGGQFSKDDQDEWNKHKKESFKGGNKPE